MQLTSGFDFWSYGHLLMAILHLLTTLVAITSIHSAVIDSFRNLRWRASPSWIFMVTEFGTFQHAAIDRCLSYVPNLVQISYNPWDPRTFVSVIRLITSRELTSGFSFWSFLPRSYRRDSSSHQIWYRYMYLLRRCIFTKFKMAAVVHLGFVGEIWAHPRRRMHGAYFH